MTHSLKRLYGVWITGGIALCFIFAIGIQWLWVETLEDSAVQLNIELLSSMQTELAEGNLFKLSSSLSKLKSEGQILGALVTGISSSSAPRSLYKTFDPVPEVFFLNYNRILKKGCNSGLSVFTRFNGITELSTIATTSVAGADCVILSIKKAIPKELITLRNNLIFLLGLFVLTIGAILLFVTFSYSKKVANFEQKEKEKDLEKKVALSELALQVSHDIKSPLTALEVMIAESPQLPEHNRVMIRRAAGRIRDITNQLVSKNANNYKMYEGSVPSAHDSSVQLLSSLIESLITEKRMQYRAKLEVEIRASLDTSSYGIFTNVPPTELTDVLSNLINNSVDALPEKGEVTVTLQTKDNKIDLRVQDSGKGIPPEIIPNLMQKGFTYNKEGGSGFGLYYARLAAESWGGMLRIESQVGRGTSAIMSIPRAESPSWFFKELALSRNMFIAILDDDESIHQVWKTRLESVNLQEYSIQLFHFSTCEDLKKWHSKTTNAGLSVFFLIDYELLGQSQTGLDLIEELQVHRKSVLVTSRYDETKVLTRCTQLGVKLLPKGMAAVVPIRVRADRELFDAILIDDDDLIRCIWESSAETAGLKIKTFGQPDEFMEITEFVDFNTKIYVDAHLAKGVRGEKISLEISKMGFSKVFLSTSFQPEHLPAMPWLQAILNKEPPWKSL